MNEQNDDEFYPDYSGFEEEENERNPEEEEELRIQSEEARQEHLTILSLFIENSTNKLSVFSFGRKVESTKAIDIYTEVIEEGLKHERFYKSYPNVQDQEEEYFKNRIEKIMSDCRKGIEDIRILELKLTEEKKLKVIEESKRIQFDYSNSLWKRLFDKNSFNNELYGQLLFHVVVGVITDLRIPKKDGYIYARPHLFLMQNSGTGKNKGMEFAKKIVDKLNKKDIENGVVINARPICCEKIDNQSDAAMLNRPIIEKVKGVEQPVIDKNTGVPQLIYGVLGKADLIWYEEANFLLNPVSKFSTEAVRIYLTHLQPGGEPYWKELERWHGVRVPTYGNYGFVALTTPVSNIKRHILGNGLLMRVLFLPRIINQDDRNKMAEQVALHQNMSKEEIENYTREFEQLVVYLETIQTNALTIPPIITEEMNNYYRSELNKFMLDIFKRISDSFTKRERKTILESFAARYYEQINILAFQSALIRGSKTVELGDLNYALTLIGFLFEEQVKWLEENIEEESKDSVKLEVRKRAIKEMKVWFAQLQLSNPKYKGKPLKLSQARNFICERLGVSFPTAKAILEEYARPPHSLLTIENKQVDFKF